MGKTGNAQFELLPLYRNIRTPPLSFGISALRTGDGLYLPFLVLLGSSSRCSFSRGSASSAVIPFVPFPLELWLLPTSCGSLLLRIFSSARPPRVSVITFTSYICCIYALNFGQYRTLFCSANSSISKRLLCSFFCHACSGLSAPSYYACREHKAKGLRTLVLSPLSVI